MANWKIVNDKVSHERRSKVLTSQSRDAAKSMVMYANEFKTKENQKLTEIQN